MGSRGSSSAGGFGRLEAEWNAAARPVKDAAAIAYKNPQRDFSVYTEALGKFEKLDGEVQQAAIKKYGKGLNARYDDIQKKTRISINGDRTLTLKGGDAGDKSLVTTYLSKKDMAYEKPEYKTFNSYKEAFNYAKKLNKE